MKLSLRSTNRGRALVATLVSAAFVWTLVLGVSPQLHACVHSDANTVEHTCAVTFISSGSYEHSANPPLVSAAKPVAEPSDIPALNPSWIPSPFLNACVFEHAPPVSA